MADIAVNGIDRGNTHENAVPNACTLILNARKNGSKWEQVGDKANIGKIIGNCSEKHIYWHYRYGNETVIIFNSVVRAIQAVDMSGILKNDFRSSNGETPFFIPQGEELYSIHSLNDYVVVDTDKNKYFFVWEDGVGTFVKLPDLPELEFRVDSSHVSLSNNDSCGKSNGLYVDNDKTMWNEQLQGFLANSSELIRMYETKIKENILKKNCIIPSLNFFITYELTDGSIIKMSNIGKYVDRFPYIYSQNTNENVFCYRISSPPLFCKRKNNNGYFNKYRDEDDREEMYNSLDGVNLYYSGSPDSAVYTAMRQNGRGMIKAYNKFDILLTNTDLYNDIKLWIDKGVLKSISVYLTAPQSYLKRMDCYEVTPGFEFYEPDMLERVNRFVYCPYDNEAAVGFNSPFYKVGEFDLLKKEIKFSLTADMQKNIEASGSTAIKIEQDLSRVIVSKKNNLYNGMIHKYDVKNIIKDDDLFLNELITTDTSSFYDPACAIDLKINNKWNRYHLYFLSSNWSHITSLTQILVNTQSIQDANIVYQSNSEWYVFKNFDIKKDNFLNLSVLEFPINDNLKSKDILKKNISYSLKMNNMQNYVGSDPTDDYYKIISTSYTELLRVTESVQNYIFPMNKFITELKPSPPTNKISYEISDEEDFNYWDSNRMQLSETNNPFVYPAKRSYRFNDLNNVVIKAETASVELSVYKFGQLPMYVFTTQGIWIMEVGAGDIAYSSQHLLENVECIDNPHFIKRVLGGVIFCAKNGIHIVSNGAIKKIGCSVEGGVLMQCVSDIATEMETDEILLSQTVQKIDNVATDYFTQNSFSVYDSFHNEILFIEPSKDFTIVLNLNDFTYSMRIDRSCVKGEEFDHFLGTVLINNRDVLLTRHLYHGYIYFFGLDETKGTRNISNTTNSTVLFATTTLFSPNYMKVEHLIARFLQSCNANHKSNVYLFVIGSRDGVEWKIISKGKIKDLSKQMQGAELRRCFTSCRYFQFVFAIKDVGKYTGEDRLLNNFSGFGFDFMPCDNNKKLR